MSIFADDDNRALAEEFEAACNDPEGLDCGFEVQRVESGFANFGYDAAEAEELREAEYARMEAADDLDDEAFPIEQPEEWDEVDDDFDDDFDDVDDWDDEDDIDFIDDEDDDDWGDDETDWEDEE